MIHRISSHAIHPEKWTHCVTHDPLGLPYAQIDYLDLVADHWEALVLGDYEAVMPLVVRRKWGLPYAARPYGTQQVGVYSSGKVTNEAMAAFLKEASKGVLFADLYLNEGNPTPPVRGWTFAPQTNLVPNLHPSYEALHQGFSKQVLRNLKTAEKQGYTLFEHDGPDALIALFRAHKGQETSLTPAQYDKMKQIMFKGLHSRRGHLWMAYGPGNQLEAGVFLWQTRKRLILLFSASSDQGKEGGAMTWLLNEMLIHFSGMEWSLDFEGSNIPGLARFYSGFGAERRVYHRAVYYALKAIF